MVKRVFVSYSYSKREEFRGFHTILSDYFSTKDIDTYSFVFDFLERLDDKQLMEAALAEIDKSDLVLVELSNNSVGVGIEAGYAKAKGKKIGYMCKKGSELKQTMNGISDYVIYYSTAEDVVSWLENNQNVLI